jgi:pimeloyl-ACP methyl ester carboxylesterase
MRIPLSEYVQAVAVASESLERPLALVGHSMGGFIIQKYLETADADMAILLASVPPTGAFGMVKRMATRRPLAFLRTMITSEATDSEQRTRDYFFSPTTPAPIVKEVHRRLQPESRQVLRDMMTALHSERVRTPVVVMGAARDWLVAPGPELLATARAFHTTAQTFPGGHDMMLDVAWEQVANAIDSAMLQHIPPVSVRPIQSEVDANPIP